MANETIGTIAIINDLFLGDEAVSVRRAIRSSVTLNCDAVCKYIHQPNITTQGRSLIKTGTLAGPSLRLCSNPLKRRLSLAADQVLLTSRRLQLHAASLAPLVLFCSVRRCHCDVNLECSGAPVCAHQRQERRKGQWVRRTGVRMALPPFPPHYASAGQRRRRRHLNITTFICSFQDSLLLPFNLFSASPSSTQLFSWQQ